MEVNVTGSRHDPWGLPWLHRSPATCFLPDPVAPMEAVLRRAALQQNHVPASWQLGNPRVEQIQLFGERDCGFPAAVRPHSQRVLPSRLPLLRKSVLNPSVFRNVIVISINLLCYMYNWQRREISNGLPLPMIKYKCYMACVCVNVSARYYVSSERQF